METDCTSSSSPAEHAAGFSASLSVAVAVSSGSAASPWSPWPRPGRKRWPTASSPVRAETPLPRSDAPRASPPSPKPPARVLEQKRDGWRGRKRSDQRVDSQPEAGTPSLALASCRSPRSPAPIVLEILTPYLAPEVGSIGPAGAPAASGGPGMGRSHGVPHRQPLRQDRTGPGSNNMTLPSTCGPCPIGRWLRPSGTVRAAAALGGRPNWPSSCLVLTAARWNEVRWAEWEEIDRDAECLDRPGQGG